MTRSRPVAYRALADDLRARLRAGDWSDGSALPTEHELAARHRLSRQTVRRAMQELVAEGAVYRVPGRGTFAVAEPMPYLRQFGSVEDLMGLSQDTELEVVAPLERVADAVAAGALDLAEPTVAAVTFVRRHGDEVFCRTSVFLPGFVADLLDDVPELTRRGARSTATVLGLVDARLPSPVTSAYQTITADLPDRELRQVLRVGVHDPLLRVERLYRDDAGRAVEWAVSHFVPRHYAYRATLRRHLH